MLEYIIGGDVAAGVILKIINSEKLIEYLANYVKKQKTSVKSNISNSEFKEFVKVSKESTRDTRNRCVYSPYWPID